MAQDYHIYVHFKGETKTSSSNGAKPKNPSNQSENFVAPTQLANLTKQTFLKEASSASGVAFASAIAVAYAVGKTIMKGVEFVQNIQASTGGDYSGVVQRENFFKQVNMITKPITSGITAYLQQQQYDIDNDRKRQARLLTGDSLLFKTSSRGL